MPSFRLVDPGTQAQVTRLGSKQQAFLPAKPSHRPRIVGFYAIPLRNERFLSDRLCILEDEAVPFLHLQQKEICFFLPFSKGGYVPFVSAS